MKIKVKNPVLKYLLIIIAIAVGGFALLNIVFMIFALIINGILLLFPKDAAMDRGSLMPILTSIVSALFLIGYYFIYRSKAKPLYKAILMPIPTAIVLVGIGVSFYRWPVVGLSLSALLVLATLYYFHRTKQPWTYYFAVILVAIALLIMSILGIDI